MSIRTITIFLGSSEELVNDRNSFSDLIRSLDDIYEPRGIRVKLKRWEDFLAYCTGTRTQDDYNRVLTACDICVSMFHRKAGKFTIEEFEKSMEAYQRTQSPKTYVYARALVEGEVEEEELKQFKEDLFKQIGHYWCNYATEDSMKLHFVMQFEHLLNGDAAQSNLKVDGGSVMLHGRKIADYANLPFASENSEMKILIEKISSLDKEVAELRALNIENLRPTINTKLTERNECQKQLDQLKKQLLDMALFISKIISSSNPIGERKRLAIEMFETGNNKGILDVLNEADIASERERAKAELAYGKQLVKTGKEMIAAAEQKIRSLVEELIMKAKTWMRTFSEPNRFEKACKCYERAIQYTRESLHSMDLAKLLYEYASFLQDNNQFDGVNDYYQEALDLRKQEGLVSEDDREYEADILNRMAVEFVARGRFEDAEQLYLQSIQIREGLVCWTKLGVATTYNNLGCLYREIRQYNKAEDCFQSALRIYDQRRYDYDFILSKANTLKNLCTLYVQIDRLDDAENAMLKALAILEENKRLSDEDSIGQYAGFLSYTGWLYRQKKQLDKAEKYLLDSLNAYQPLADQYPEKYQLYIASLQDQLGVVCRMMKRYEEAEKYHRNALDCYEKLYEIDSDVYNKDLALVLCHLAILYAENNNMEAEKLFLQSIQLYETLTPESMPDLAFVVHNLACFYYEAKQWNEAKVNFQRAVEMYEVLVQSVSDVYEKSLAGNLCNLGATYEKLDSLINAETYYLRALEINERLVLLNPKEIVSQIENNLHFLDSLYEIPKFSSCQRKCDTSCWWNYAKLSDAYLSDNKDSIAHIFVKLADSYESSNRTDISLQFLRHALEIYKELALNNDEYLSTLAEVNMHLSTIYQDLENYTDAEKYALAALKNYESYVVNHEEEAALVFSAQYNLFNIYLVAEKYPQAEEMGLLTLKSHERYVVTDDEYAELKFELHNIQYLLALLYQEIKKYEYAEKYARLALEGFRCYAEELECEDNIAVGLNILSFTSLIQKKYRIAEEYAYEALEYDDVVDIYTNLAAAILLQGRFEEAKQIYMTYKEDLRDTFLEDFQALKDNNAIPKHLIGDVEKIIELLHS